MDSSTSNSIVGSSITTTTSLATGWKFCPECGQKLDAGWKFCANCGKRIEASYQWAYIPPITQYIYGGTQTIQPPFTSGSTCGGSAQ